MRDDATIYPDRDVKAEAAALEALAEYIEPRVADDPDNVATREAFAVELEDTPRRPGESEADHQKRIKAAKRGFNTARYAVGLAAKRVLAGRDVGLVPGDFGLAILDVDDGAADGLLDAHPPYAYWRSDGKNKGYHFAYERTPLLLENVA